MLESANKVLSYLLIFLLLAQHLPANAATLERTVGASPAERSLAIEEAFFDGSEAPIAPKTAPFHLADSFYDYKG
ncbi:MAG: hypothetical protein AABZ44_10000, partial [Elusimicrobiota bacterium]